MSAFSSFLERVIKEPVVYWGNARPNGHGGFLYDHPVEILTFWNDRIQVLSADSGDKIISRAFVYVLEELQVEGLLYRGRLCDLTDEEKLTPSKLESMCIIKRFEKYPGINNVDFVRIAFLTPWLT